MEVRARLLAVAGRLFSSRGFSGVRLDQIADEAKVARGTLYSHFDSKEELLLAIVQPVLERAVECLQRIPETASPREAVDGLLRSYFDLWRISPDALALAHRFEQPLPPDVMALHEVFVRLVVGVMQRAAGSGLLRLADPLLSARVLATTAVPLLQGVSGLPDPQAAFLDSMAGLLLRSC